jgi:hypothetical protein
MVLRLRLPDNLGRLATEASTHSRLRFKGISAAIAKRFYKLGVS